MEKKVFAKIKDDNSEWIEDFILEVDDGGFADQIVQITSNFNSRLKENERPRQFVCIDRIEDIENDDNNYGYDDPCYEEYGI